VGGDYDSGRRDKEKGRAMNIEQILATKGRAVSTVDRTMRVGAAVAQMRKERIGALVVTADGGVIQGIISDRGVLWAIADRGSEVLEDQVESVMTPEVITCRAEDPVAGIMATMTERRVRHIPVVDGNGTLEGIVSIGDIVKYRLDEIQDEANALRDYITTVA
jgi:CBS domain-containing protein